MEEIYKKYLTEKLDVKGKLKSVSFNYPNNFNFGYDILDEIAKKNHKKKKDI